MKDEICMKKTKIVCTLGPASASKVVLNRMIQGGMDCARINMSHGNHEMHKEYIKLLRKLDSSVPIILDLKGTGIRINELKVPLPIRKNMEIKLSGTPKKGALLVSYPKIHKAAHKGMLILMDDGLLKFRVTKVKAGVVHCKALNANVLKNNKKVTLPGANLDITIPTTQDKKDIRFALSQKVEFIALSFVKTKKDIQRAKNLVKKGKTKLITKIETLEAVRNFDDILKETNGVMIARGDLGVEMPPEDVPLIQKNIIQKCTNVGKPVITATQMLESMILNPLPTRAETSDVANAILDGTDAIMLSGESAIGNHPVDAVRIMDRISKRVEKYVTGNATIHHDTISQHISHAVNELARELADKIIVTTTSGFTGRMVSRFKPKTPILVVTHDDMVRNQLRLSWGITPLMFTKKIKHSHRATHKAVRECYRKRIVKKSDKVILTGGISTGEAGHTNLIEVHLVKDILENKP